MGEVEQVLYLRQQAAKASVKKFQALNNAQVDDRLNGCFQYCGASRTGREAGRIFQPQNLPKPTLDDECLQIAVDLLREGELDLFEVMFPDVLTALSSVVRAAIRAPGGKRLVVADFASVENCGTGWVTDSETMLEVYRQGLDPYRDFATRLFRIAYGEVTGSQRKFCKPACLGCQYGLGTKGLMMYAEGMGVLLSEDESEHAKKTWRETYHEVPAYWRVINTAVRRCIQRRKTYQAGPIEVDWFEPLNGFRLRLPSGRYLHYANAELQELPAPWDKDEEILTITYEGTIERATGGSGAWGRIKTFAGKLLENIVQAVCRDVLWVSIQRAEDAGLVVVGHVHDEIIVEAEEARAEESLQLLLEIMRTPIKWADGFPLDATGYVSPYYRKD